MRNLSGRLTAPTTEGVEYTYTALEADGTTVEDHLDMDYVLTLTIHVRNADLQPFFTTSVKSETITEGDDLDEAALARLVLPMASGGNEPVNYAVTGVPTGFVAPPEGTTPGEITGGMNAKVGTYLITLTATDVDKDKASLSFTITVEKNVKPSVGNISDMSFTVGDEVEVLLPAGSGGNGELMYSTSALPGGLELSTKRYLHGELAEDATVGQTIVTYTVTDRDGDTAVDSFVITINAAE